MVAKSPCEHYLWGFEKQTNKTHFEFVDRNDSVLRCGDAAGLPEGAGASDSTNLKDLCAMTELVTSSQGSPIANPAAPMSHLIETENLDRLMLPHRGCASTIASPASSKVTAVHPPGLIKLLWGLRQPVCSLKHECLTDLTTFAAL